MGQKINPQSFRLGVSQKWPTRWFVKADRAKLLEQDEIIRNAIKEKISQAGVAEISIERTSNKVLVNIKAARPGFVIGRGGKGIEDLTKYVIKKLGQTLGKQNAPLTLNVEELKRTESSAVYLAQQMAWEIERRVPFRRMMKKQIDQVMQNRDVRGAKILMGGRLDGAEIARREWLKRGQLPLQKLRAVIDYGTATAYTTYGTIGIKVWLYKGDVHEEDNRPRDNRPSSRRPS